MKKIFKKNILIYLQGAGNSGANTRFGCSFQSRNLGHIDGTQILNLNDFMLSTYI